MYHVFLTRLAVDFRLLNASNKKAFPYWKIHRDIIFWHRFGSRFYHQQTVDEPFEVRIAYSPRYAQWLFRYDYPEWVKFFEFDNPETRTGWRDVRDAPRPTFVHRIDADDQFPSDFFERLQPFHANRTHEAILYDRYRQFLVDKRLTSARYYRNPAPHFLSVLLRQPSDTLEGGPHFCKHGSVPKRFRCHHAGTDIPTLESIHKRNWVNRKHRGEFRPEQDPRFAYFGQA